MFPSGVSLSVHSLASNWLDAASQPTTANFPENGWIETVEIDPYTDIPYKPQLLSLLEEDGVSLPHLTYVTF
ncbi:hypothetical protein EYZ11_004835 [Aspergillus tanneri]|uniref:Uncharacterized protein n=1 Tax=Aspergillus tanneri TaxID=1220188 RepID=A0A4S3JLU6_9EURO|nr:hypothetical protein EYZ11_004835 [Aspergillus tanneri]